MFYLRCAVDNRYQAQLALSEIGIIGQQKLSGSRVLCVGGGGLAASVLPYLVAAGVGKITIIDHDIVSLSNLNRQILFNHEDLGKYKSKVLSEKLKVQNPDVDLAYYCDSFSLENGKNLISNHDLIIDCCDDYLTKVTINYYCAVTNTPWVFGSVLGWDGQIALLKMSCDEDPCYKCWQDKSPIINQSCSVSGVLGVAVNIIGSFQASLAIQALLGNFTESNKLFVFDLLTLEMTKFQLHHQEKCSFHKQKTLQSNIAEVDLITCQDTNQYLLIDIRTSEEWENGSLEHAQHMPIGVLMSQLEQLKLETKKIVLYCNQQTLSRLAAENLQHAGINACVLKGGYLKNISTKLKE